MYRAGHDDQTATLFGHPTFQQIDLHRIEQLPVGVYGHDAIVLEHFQGRGREVRENLIGFLRHTRSPALEQHVDGRRTIAKQHGAKEAVIPRGSAGEQQHAVLAIDNFHVDLAKVVFGVTVSIGSREAEAQCAAARLVGRQLELDRQHLAVGAEGDSSALLYVAGSRLGTVSVRGRA